jgi:hypothetical protein
VQFGDRQIFAIEVGSFWDDSCQLREIDIWAAGHQLTYYDNCAYLPSFIHALEYEMNHLSRTAIASEFSVEDYRGNVKSLYEACITSASKDKYRFVDYGATTDGVRAYIFRDSEQFLITFQFRPEHPYLDDEDKIFFVLIAKHALLEILHRAVSYIRLYASNSI